MVATNATTGALLADAVEVADTHVSRAVGLLSRSGLSAGEALWIVPSRGVHTCGMRFPIDVLAIDDRGVVVDCIEAMKPWRVRLPRRGAIGVLELRAGRLAETRTALGHVIRFDSPEAGNA
jgi:uncharacterized membrane protein (UPF0127 family)